MRYATESARYLMIIGDYLPEVFRGLLIARVALSE